MSGNLIFITIFVNSVSCFLVELLQSLLVVGGAVQLVDSDYSNLCYLLLYLRGQQTVACETNLSCCLF